MGNRILGNAYLDPFNMTGWKQNNPYNVDYSTMPQYPQLTPLTQFQPDETGLNDFREQATRTGPSTWANEATAKSYTDQANAMDAASKSAASNTATSKNALAMQGGLRSGAAERVQTSGNRDAMSADQQLAAGGNSNRQQIGINDEQNRITQLGMLPGMEEADAGFKENEASGENQQLLSQYGTQASMWGAGQQANATAAAAPAPKQGPSWLCTESKKMASTIAWSGSDGDALGELRHYGLKHDRALSAWYLRDAKGLIDRMHAARDVNWPGQLLFIERVIALVKQGKIKSAHAMFKGRIHDLVATYWPEISQHVEDL